MRSRLTRLIPLTIPALLWTAACAEGARAPHADDMEAGSDGAGGGSDDGGAGGDDLGLEPGQGGEATTGGGHPEIPSTGSAGRGWHPTGTTSGGSASGPANDTCDSPAALSVELSSFASITGTLADAKDDYAVSCTGAQKPGATPDAVYELTVTGSGLLTILLDNEMGGAGFDGVLSLRRGSCADEAEGDACVAATPASEAILKADVTAGTYYVVVESAGGEPGSFGLTATLDPPKCGDGILNAESAGEECDLFPADPSKCNPPGHPAQCKAAAPKNEALDTCPGKTIQLPMFNWMTIGPNDSRHAADDHVGSCAGPNTGGRDQVFRVSPEADGTLTITVGIDPSTGEPFCNQCGETCPEGCWIPLVYVRQGGCEGAVANEIACHWDDTLSNGVASVEVPVQAGQDYWVFVDSPTPGLFGGGEYYLQASLTP